jgi:cytochrome P450 family 6
MILLTVIFLFGAFYLLNSYIFNYWKRRNIPQADGQKILVGNAATMFLRKECLGEFFQTFYNKYKHHKFIGVYLSYRPVLIINDPELIQDIMIKNFTSFHDRPVPINEEADPLTKNLFFIKGQKWRDLRVKMSPTFTSGKLKMMFSIMSDCGKVLQDYIDRNLQENKNIFEFRDLLARFTTNIISSVAFGIENDCINERDNIFRKMGMKIFDQGLVQGMKNVIGLLTPAFFVRLNISLFHRDIYDFIVSLIHQTIDYREKNNFHRNDFMQLLIELKNQGYISVDKNSNDEDEIEWKFEPSNGHETKKLTIEDIAAQVFVFFAAGTSEMFDNSSF